MNQPKPTNPKSNPDPAVVSPEEANPMVQKRAAGSALQDVEAAARKSRPDGKPVDHPAATNYSDAAAQAAKTAGASSVDGPYEGEGNDRDRVSLQNNPNPPEDEAVQGNLPGSDPMSRPHS